MSNPFSYSNDNKRYHTWNYHLKEKYNQKVFKVSLNAGFTCPNIDGTKGIGGCIYCSNKGSGDFAGNPAHEIKRQFKEIRDRMHQKWPEGKYIAYFQAYTNTYAPTRILREKYEAALEMDDVVGLSISTRPDCLSDETINYLAELNERTDLWVELGLQSIYDETANFINRAHNYEEFINGLNKLRKHNIKVCVHIINGLPNETKEMMLETAKTVGQLDVQGIKIHLLHVIKDTKLADYYYENQFKTLEQEEYVDIVCDQLEVLPKEMIIQRITGDGAADDLIAPLWSLKKFIVMNEIDKELVRRDSYQGKYYNDSR